MKQQIQQLLRKTLLILIYYLFQKFFGTIQRVNVLTLEEIDGIACTDIESMDELGIDRKVLAENGVKIFLDQVFRDNFFHADMHPGNIFVSKGKYRPA